MKKVIAILLSALMVFGLFGCGGTNDNTATDDKTIESLSIAFVPSKDSAEILAAAEPLGRLLSEQLAALGWTIDPANIDVSVGTNYEVVGEGLQAGSIDLGFIPAGDYVTVHDAYPDDVNLLLTSSRAAVSVDVDPNLDASDFRDWNKGVVTDADEPAAGYRSLVYVNVYTDKGKDLLAKAEAGTLTWDDINSATIACGSTSSGASYKYPSAWLNKLFGTADKKVTLADCANVVSGGNYSGNFELLLEGQVDITFGYADVRKDAASTEAYEALKADGHFEGSETVFDVVKCIGVSDMIMNDTISYGSDDKFTPELVDALRQAFINLIATDEGKACLKPYSHTGYLITEDSDYDGVREVNKLFSDN